MAENFLINFLISAIVAILNSEIDQSLGFHFGVQEKGSLYVTTAKIRLGDNPYDCQPNTLWQVDLDRGRVARRTVVRSYLSPDPMALRWTIHNSTLISIWSYDSGECYNDPQRFRLEDVHMLDEANPRGEELLIKKYNLNAEAVRRNGLNVCNERSQYINPNNKCDWFYSKFLIGATNVMIKPMEHSIWVSPDGLVSEFLLHKKTMYVAIAKKVSPGRGKPPDVYLSAWQKLKVDFQEPFLVFADMKRHYFVTRSGKVYCVDRLDIPFEFAPKVEAYFVDRQRPVRTIVSSPEHMRTFLAGSDGAKQYYFELDFENSKQANLKPYKPDLKAEYPKPIEDVSRFATFLNEQKLFSLPDEKRD